MSGNWADRLGRWNAALEQVSGLGLLVRAAKGDLKNHSKDMAASIAFYSMLSLFPLILGMVAVAGSILRSEQLQGKVMEWVNEFFPVGADFITQSIESLVRLRGAAGLVSVLMLFWSAGKMVGAISRGVNKAMDLERSHAFYLSPLRNFTMVLSISLLMFATAAISPFADMISELDLSRLGSIVDKTVNLVGGKLLSAITTATMLAATYLVVSYRRPAWPDLWPAVLTATVLIELAKKLFVLYVNNVSKLDALYGSISSIIVLMLWLYFFGRVLLFGASIIRVRQLDRSSEEASE